MLPVDTYESSPFPVGSIVLQESNVLAPYFFVKVDEAGNGHEVSHANELLVFVKWSLGLFNQHQVGTGGRGIPHEELRTLIEGCEQAHDVYDRKKHPVEKWTSWLVQMEREQSALAYCVETGIAMSLQMFKECKEDIALEKELRPENNNIWQRAKRIGDAEGIVRELRKMWDCTTLDRNFFLNTERDFNVCLESLKKKWHLTEASRYHAEQGQIH